MRPILLLQLVALALALLCAVWGRSGRLSTFGSRRTRLVRLPSSASMGEHRLP
jgi:hypothetical protein